MAIDPFARLNEGLAGMQNTMLTLANLRRQDKQDAQAATLQGLQTQAAQQSVDEGKLKLSTLNAGRSALIDQYGTQGQTDPYAQAVSFQQQEAADKAKLEAKQKGFETYLGTIKALDGMGNLDATTKTEIGKHFLAQNPEYAEVAKNLKYVDSKGVKAARQFAEGELKDPATGKPLPAGFYETEGVWTGDAAQPVKLISYKLTAPPKAEAPEYKSRERKSGRQIIFEESKDGGKTWARVGDPSPIDKPGSTGGQEPVAQTTFVDAETGKPLVFDKKTGTYRIANVEGGVAPKPGAMSPEQATRAQQFETILTNIPKIREMVLDKKGNIISRLDIANSQAGTWGTKGREIRQAVKRTVEQALRIATGAAAPDSEVANYTDMYAPQIGDTKEQIAEKFKALETFAEGTRAKFNIGRSPQAIKQGKGGATGNTARPLPKF